MKEVIFCPDATNSTSKLLPYFSAVCGEQISVPLQKRKNVSEKNKNKKNDNIHEELQKESQE